METSRRYFVVQDCQTGRFVLLDGHFHCPRGLLQQLVSATAGGVGGADGDQAEASANPFLVTVRFVFVLVHRVLKELGRWPRAIDVAGQERAQLADGSGMLELPVGRCRGQFADLLRQPVTPIAMAILVARQSQQGRGASPHNASSPASLDHSAFAAGDSACVRASAASSALRFSMW